MMLVRQFLVLQMVASAGKPAYLRDLKGEKVPSSRLTAEPVDGYAFKNAYKGTEKFNEYFATSS